MMHSFNTPPRRVISPILSKIIKHFWKTSYKCVSGALICPLPRTAFALPLGTTALTPRSPDVIGLHRNRHPPEAEARHPHASLLRRHVLTHSRYSPPHPKTNFASPECQPHTHTMDIWVFHTFPPIQIPICVNSRSFVANLRHYGNSRLWLRNNLKPMPHRHKPHLPRYLLP